MEWKVFETRVRAAFDREWRHWRGGRVLLSSDPPCLDLLTQELASEGELEEWIDLAIEPWRERWKPRRLLSVEIAGTMVSWFHAVDLMEIGDGRAYVVDLPEAEVGPPTVVAMIDPASFQPAISAVVSEILRAGGATFQIDLGSYLQGQVSVYDPELLEPARKGLREAVTPADAALSLALPLPSDGADQAAMLERFLRESVHLASN